MRTWLAHKLQQQMDQADKMTIDEYCIRLARAGDPAPLRHRYPHLAEFIYPPKLRRGQRYPKAKKRTYAEVAADFAKCIRSQWREQYGSRTRRGERTAEEYAIDILREWF